MLIVARLRTCLAINGENTGLLKLVCLAIALPADVDSVSANLVFTAL